MAMIIQTFVYPQAGTEHLLWASILTLLITRGAGALSFDYLIERYLARISRSTLAQYQPVIIPRGAPALSVRAIRSRDFMRHHKDGRLIAMRLSTFVLF
jgi:hypothetical protein